MQKSVFTSVNYSIIAVLVFALLLITSCGRDRAETWGTDVFGSDAPQIVREAQRVVQRGNRDAPKDYDTGNTYAPRPLVVMELQVHPKTEEILGAQFSSVNESVSSLGPGSGLDDVAGIIVVHKDMDMRNFRVANNKRKTRLWDDAPVQKLFVKDLRLGAFSTDVIESHNDEALVTYIQSLPESP